MNTIKTYTRCLLVILFIAWSSPAPATEEFSLKEEVPALSSRAQISILTCDPGNQLYSQFGHTAIRVTDPARQMDIVFNYGTFNFETQGFYFKFARGTLLYQLTYSAFTRFMREYRHYERSVYEQTLTLDSLGRQRLWELLIDNCEPENREYLYNFLYDNCTTRARDILSESLNGNIQWKKTPSGKSFWNELDEYLGVSPWIKWGIHTILGSPATARTTGWEEMFLPDYLMYGLDSAFYRGKPLATPIRTIYQAAPGTRHTPWCLSPLFIFSVCIAAGIFWLQKSKTDKPLRRVAVVLFVTTGIIGCLLIFLGYFTKHPTTAPNFNLFWANPLNLIAAFFAGRRTPPRWFNTYLLAYLCLLIAGFLLWPLFTPAVVYDTLPLFAGLAYLTFRLYRRPVA